MNNLNSHDFPVDWVLLNKLCVGRAPRTKSHIEKLKKQGIKSILSLCSKDEIKPPDQIEDHFICKRKVLPDHKYNREITVNEINESLEIVKEILNYGPVYIHCVASVERSPLICMAWLVKECNLNTQQALEYLMEIHPGTNPLPSHLRALNQL